MPRFSADKSPSRDRRNWLMSENTWIPLLSFVIASDLMDTPGSSPFDRNGRSAVKDDCDPGKTKFLLPTT